MLPDLRIDEERRQLNFVERNFKGKSKKLTKRLLTIDCADKLDCLQLLRAFTRATSHLRCQYFWQLPSDTGRWLATSIDDMLQRVLKRLAHDTNHHLDANGLRIPCGQVLPLRRMPSARISSSSAYMVAGLAVPTLCKMHTSTPRGALPMLRATSLDGYAIFAG
ncbi:hypothetical protein RI054_36g136530 [Pseudoscourfieldia marina]